MNIEIIPVLCAKDNYCYIMKQSTNDLAVVVDATEYSPIASALKKNKLKLSQLLITHNHYDHTQATFALLEKYPKAIGHAHVGLRTCVDISGCLDRFEFYDIHKPLDSINFNILGMDAFCYYLPGHEASSLGYLIADNFFVGDVLFKAGCGLVKLDNELFLKKMWQSLKFFQKLPPHTKIYYGHDLAYMNLRYAIRLEPQNEILQSEMAKAKQTDFPPTTLELELKINPYLRTDLDSLQESVAVYLKKMRLDDLAQTIEQAKTAEDKDFFCFRAIRLARYILSIKFTT